MAAHRSQRFLTLLEPFASVVIVTHDNPDPDAIASSWGLLTLVREKLDKPVRMVAGGGIERAENRRMVELLRPPLEFVERVESDPQTAVVLADCEPTAANHLLGDDAGPPLAVIDHHQAEPRRLRVRYRDVRPHVVATSVIVGQYLREQHYEPGAALATALLYGIRTDAVGRPFRGRVDRAIAMWLGTFADYAQLADIEQAPRDREYYGDLLLALESTFIYDDAALCFLPRANSPEIVGEIADLLLRCVGVRRVFCAAAHGDDVLVSVRTDNDADNATDLVQRTLRGIGFGGGHRRRAGGKLDRLPRGARLSEDLQTELRTRWLQACGLKPNRGARLVARREIAENL